MRTLVFAAATLALAGCAAHTLHAMRDRAPALVADSNKPTNVIGPCMVEAADNLGITTYVPGAHGATLEVKVGEAGESIMVGVDIEDQGQHRHVTIWRFKPLIGARLRRGFERMQACL